MSEPQDLYRLYRMNALTGAILSFEEFEAFSEDHAIERALAEAGERRIELWHNQRKIFAVSGVGAPAELSFPRGSR
jgi:microsomal dipeptidase-like Zn-dependent dipeptidase